MRTEIPLGFGTPPSLWQIYMDDFPHLEMAMVSDFDDTYNCIAWSLGISDRWVWNEIDLNSDGTSSLSEFLNYCLLYTSPSPRDLSTSRMPSSA